MLSRWLETGMTNPFDEFLDERPWIQKLRFRLFKLRWITWSREERGEILAQTEQMLCSQMFDNDEQRVAFFHRQSMPMHLVDVMECLDDMFKENV